MVIGLHASVVVHVELVEYYWLNYDESASSAQASDDAFSSKFIVVSILLSSIVHNSRIDGRTEGSGLMQRVITSHIALRSSYLKCFNSGSTTYDITSGISR